MIPDRLQAAPVVDELVTHEGAAVLLGGTESVVMRLSPMGQAIRELASESISLQELVARLHERFGPPPDGDQFLMVRSMVDEMVERGIIVWIAD
jgi:hypothetical protein